MDDPPSDNKDGFTYLMQFADGNRIDLGIDPPSMLPEVVGDSQSILLLDKDGIVPPLPPASDRDYLPQPPTAKAFADCCNEFWWVCPYVAKGVWRQEITYARHMQEHYVRAQLDKMLRWCAGVQTGFAASPGNSASISSTTWSLSCGSCC